MLMASLGSALPLYHADSLLMTYSMFPYLFSEQSFSFFSIGTSGSKI